MYELTVNTLLGPCMMQSQIPAKKVKLTKCTHQRFQFNIHTKFCSFTLVQITFLPDRPPVSPPLRSFFTRYNHGPYNHDLLFTIFRYSYSCLVCSMECNYDSWRRQQSQGDEVLFIVRITFLPDRPQVSPLLRSSFT